MNQGQSLADGAAGIALLHLETGDHQAARTALEHAVAGGVTTADGASLYYGAPALAFVLACAGQPGLTRARAAAAQGAALVTRRRLDAAHRRIDQHHQPRYAEFDLIRGLAGLGAASRRTGDISMLRDVLAYLVRLTEPAGGLPGWWCPHGPSRSQPGPPGGHSNHGIAHGITGPLALLALAYLDGTRVDGHKQAITRICQWLDTWQQRTGSTIWWPQAITLDDLHAGHASQPGPQRPSWCYGTPGIARAQQLAGRALGDTARQQLAETAFLGCAGDPAQTSLLTSSGLCHGTGGLLAAGRRIAADALTAIDLSPMLQRHQQASAPAGAGFLDGTAGAALAEAGATSAWDACLLLA